ncbi:MAG: YihA family ribosome biogenesis GTP-binding protein [Clostridia bacterium]|nr:YihA family ribosome biogenesis GTP-binding protein [Clostridia bacterium]
MTVNLNKAEFIRSAVKNADFPQDDLKRVVFAGKSNVGKSSVINRLLNRKNFARVGASPGKTTHINFFLIDKAFYLVDLPGYGYAKVSQQERERWGRLIEEFFADERQISFGVFIVDIRHKPTENDIIMAECFKGLGVPFCVVANKSDKLKKSQIEPALELIADTLDISRDIIIPFSAEKGDGRDLVLERVYFNLSLGE